MPSTNVTFTFPENGTAPNSQINTNFADLVGYINGGFITDSFTALSASDVTGPVGKTILMLVRDTTNGGNAVFLYETGQTPVRISNIAGAGTTFVAGVPGVNEIGVKDGTDKILFRANGTANNAALKTVTVFIA